MKIIEKKQEIIRLFYEDHLKPVEIAKELEVVKSYVTKIIQKDERYIEEKERRRQENKEKQKVCKRNFIREKRKKENEGYQALILQIKRDNEYLSTKKEISDSAFSKWNRGMYEYDKNSNDLVVNSNYTVCDDVPKRIRDVVNPDSIRARKVS